MAIISQNLTNFVAEMLTENAVTHVSLHTADPSEKVYAFGQDHPITYGTGYARQSMSWSGVASAQAPLVRVRGLLLGNMAFSQLFKVSANIARQLKLTNGMHVYIYDTHHGVDAFSADIRLVAGDYWAVTQDPGTVWVLDTTTVTAERLIEQSSV